MRGKRAKKYRKLMHQYELNFNFREPYQVLLDSQILQDAKAQKIDLVTRLQGVLGGEVKPMVTQCDMRHLYDAKPKDEAVILQAKNYERRRCGHHELEKPLPSLQCLAECVDPRDNHTNKNRYVIATQDRRVRAHMRNIPGVPLVYINKSVMILEPMATVTENLREREERAKFKAGLKGRRGTGTGEKRKRDGEEDGVQDEQGAPTAIQSTDNARPQKKRKGPKGPNPLSVKKSAKAKPPPRDPDARPKRADSVDGHDDTASAAAADAEQGHKRKRKRKPKAKGDAGSVPDVDEAIEP